MFVSSYSTFIPTALSDRTNSIKETKNREGSSFEERLSKETLAPKRVANFPVDYVAKNSGFWQKYEVQREIQKNTQESKEEKKTSLQNVQKFQSAEQAYSEGVKKFAFVLRNTKATTIDQTPKIDATLPSEIQEIKESKLRHTMVNTYLSNDRYYQLTSA
jgi:uncharacterized protein YcbK (DUF882 family)